MLMVIFGAGASYDSAPSYPPGMGLAERPPLADQLFENREQFAVVLRQFPECHEIIPRLRNRSGNSVERELEALQAQAETHPARHRQLAAVRYYLQFMLYDCQFRWEGLIKGVSNYKTLLDDINRLKKGQQVCLVTFNYDTLLESALPAVETQLHDLPDYITGNYKIIKLHGSINWGREVDTPIENPEGRGTSAVIQELIRRAGELKISERYRLVGGSPTTIVEKAVVVFPAIAIPVERKRNYECPADHLEVLRTVVPNVSMLVVIGWRATEEHFLGLLGENVPKGVPGFVVCGDVAPARATLENLAKAGVRGYFWEAPGGFSEAILSRRIEKFLETGKGEGSPLETR